MSACCAGVYKPCDPKTGYDYFIGPKEPTPKSGAGEHISQQRHAAGAKAKPCPHPNVDFPKVGTEHIRVCRDCGEQVEDTASA